MDNRTAAEEKASYRDGYERDAASWGRRLADLEATGLGEGDRAWQEAKAAVENALCELERYGGLKHPERRPKKAAETR